MCCNALSVKDIMLVVVVALRGNEVIVATFGECDFGRVTESSFVVFHYLLSPAGMFATLTLAARTRLWRLFGAHIFSCELKLVFCALSHSTSVSQ
jgi:hypothetical protein